MKVDAYTIEAEIEATHWWFTERRRLFGRLIKRFDLAPDARVLDIGTSTGTNLRMLRDLGFTRSEGLDASADAVRWCAEKGYGKVTQGSICELPFADGTFDLVLATDVIEHVDDDAAALREIRRVLKPKGHVLITVPAFQALWGVQDEISLHKRRYRAAEVLERARNAGLAVSKKFYFNYVLFLPIMFARLVLRNSRSNVRSENEINSPWVNRILKAIFRFDVWTAPVLQPPFGVSYLVVAVPAAG